MSQPMHGTRRAPTFALGALQKVYSDLQLADLLNAFWPEPQKLFIDQNLTGQGLVAWAAVASNNGLMQGYQTNNFGSITGCGQASDSDACSGSCWSHQLADRCAAVYGTAKEGIEDWAQLVTECPEAKAALNGKSTRRLAYAMLTCGVFGERRGRAVATEDLNAIERKLDRAIDQLVEHINADPESHETNLWTDKTWVAPPPRLLGGESGEIVDEPAAGGMGAGGRVLVAGGALAGAWLLWKVLT